MALLKKTEVVATPRLPPGYEMVHGRVRGPSDQTRPPGTGGALPRMDNFVYDKVVIVTITDTNSGHTQVFKTSYVQPANGSYSTVPGVDPERVAEHGAEMVSKAMQRAEGQPGHRFTVGRPEEVTQAQVDAFNAYLDDLEAPQPADASETVQQVPGPAKTVGEIEAEALAALKKGPVFHEEAAKEAATEARPKTAAEAPAAPAPKSKK